MRVSCVLFAFAFTISSASAQQQLSLDQCIAIGMERNYTLKSSAAQMQSSSGAQTAAFGQFLPSISLNGGYSRNLDGKDAFFFTPQGIRTSPGTYTLSGSINYTIFNGFANTAGYNQASENYNASALNFNHSRQDITYQIIQAYLKVQNVEQLMKVQEDNLKVGNDQLTLVKAQYQVGSVPQANVLTQQTQVANDQVAYIQAKNNWNVAKNSLIALIGLDPENDYAFSASDLPTDVSSSDEKAFREKIGDIHAAIARALDQRPDVQASQNQMNAAQSSITVARSGYYPSISADIAYGWRNADFTQFSDLSSTSLGISVSFPLFDKFQTNDQIQIADANYQTAQANYGQMTLTVRTQVKQSYYDLDAAEEQLDATSAALSSAEENRRTAEERYKLGAGTELDFLTAQSQYLTAEVNRINAVYGYLGAQYEVEYMTGTLSR